ncbi:uncharacterized protein LOC125740872 isoform X3 [Brienomyrus brachyistius]|uniref:uncharacterized protein LOC125740872 isoform X3 n=1 Tax=Brienomyrus brachyistius TaxID=42636 RepID=UPI0020B2FF0D|nr:uncharacterized protein LOC125740872 isoform X3 [Brienomyrus brachyistius]
MFFSLAFLCCSAALVIQAEELVVIEVQPGGAATLPCGIPGNKEVSWISLQSDHIPARVMDLRFSFGYDMDLVNIREEYRGRLVPVSDSNTHSLQLKNITAADLLIYCCIQSSDLKFGNCTKLKFTDPPGGQSTPHPLQCPTPQPETLNPGLYNPDLLPWILLPCVALLISTISSLCCYLCYNQVLLRKSSDSQQRGSRTSRHDQGEYHEVQYVSVKFKSSMKRVQKRAEDEQDTVYAGIK